MQVGFDLKKTANNHQQIRKNFKYRSTVAKIMEFDKRKYLDKVETTREIKITSSPRRVYLTADFSSLGRFFSG